MAVVSRYREPTSVGSTKTVEGSFAAYRHRRDTIGPLKCSGVVDLMMHLWYLRLMGRVMIRQVSVASLYFPAHLFTYLHQAEERRWATE